MTRSFDIFDVHHHFGASPVHDDEADTTLHDQVQEHIDQLRANDIAGAAMLPPPTFPNPKGLEDTRAMNDLMARLRDEYTEWFPVTGGYVNPSYGEAGLPEIDRALDDLDLDALVWHNRFQGATPDAPIMVEFVERAATYDAVIHLHAYVESGADELWRIFNLVERFPDVTFVVHDVFSGYYQGQHLVSRGAEFENVLWDTSAAAFLTMHVERFVDAIGADQLIFGTDHYSDFPTRKCPEIDAIEAAAISQDDMEQIFSGNFNRIYNL